jgi:glycosyltransferase involved in cell wall biosynthesis
MKKNILLISPVPSHPQIAGNRARICSLALSIKALGHELYFAHVQVETGDTDEMTACWGGDHFFSIPYARPNKLSYRIRRKMKSFFDSDAKYTSYIDAWYDDSIDDQLKIICQKINFDVVIVEYVFFSRALMAFPGHVLKLIDTHDVMTDRHKIYLRNNSKYNWFSTTARQERKGLRRADTIIAIQEGEKKFFAELAGKKTITVGHTVKTIKREIETSPKGRILFIGSANQSNIDAINRFIREMFPKIQKEVPAAKLFVVGPVGRVLKHFNEAIINLGEPERLDDIYTNADIVINPIRFGTGLKIKNIEAMGYAKPLVTTRVGAEGMQSGIGTAFLVANSDDDFSDCVVNILRDPLLFKRLSNAGLDFANSWNQKQEDALISVLEQDRSGFANP